MAMWKSVSLLFMVLQLLLSAGADVVNPPTLTIMSSPDDSDTVTILCEASPGDVLEAIEIGLGSALAFPSITLNTLARLTDGDQIITNGQNNDLAISGHLNSTHVVRPYLKIDIHKPSCRYDGPIYCKLMTFPVTFVSSSANLTVCDHFGQIAITVPIVSNPTNFVVNCHFDPNATSVESVKYVALHRQRRLWGQSEEEDVAFINATEHDGQARAFPNFTETQVRIRGSIDRYRPLRSELKVEFNTGTCAEAGEYTCKFLYTKSGSAEKELQLAQGTVANACDNNCLTTSVRPIRTGDPTDLDVSCWMDSGCPPVLSVISQELSVVNADNTRTLMAFNGKYSSQPETGLYSSYSNRNVTVVSEPSDHQVWKLAIRDGSCKDAGRYQCKLAYHDDTHNVRTLLTETPFQACLPGALANVRHRPSSSYIFTCQVDPDHATTILSFEISVIVDRRRVLLVSLDAYLNNGRPIRHHDSDDFNFFGIISPTHVASSYLNMDAGVHSLGNDSDLYVTSCKAVFVTGTGEIRTSFDDRSIPWRP